jgi:uncharacterized tellurite resistance protein B-like protein
MEKNLKASEENWTKDDLRVYIMLFCANADLTLKEEEIAFIKEKTHNAKYDDLRAVFENDNDYQGTEKIEKTIKRLGYTEGQIEDLIAELKELFWADGKFDAMENAILHHIERILKQ